MKPGIAAHLPYGEGFILIYYIPAYFILREVIQLMVCDSLCAADFVESGSSKQGGCRRQPALPRVPKPAKTSENRGCQTKTVVFAFTKLIQNRSQNHSRTARENQL